MQIYLTDQRASFPKHLDRLRQVKVASYSRSHLVEKESSIDIPSRPDILSVAAGLLFSYDIFPAKIMAHFGAWIPAGRQMQVGDTIVQQAFIPPFKAFSQKIIFGVRVNSIIQEQNCVGFSYETLEGHVEQGISTFSVELRPDHCCIFKIHTYSKPGNLLTRLIGPIISVPYQTYCTNQALQHFRSRVVAVS